MVTIWPAHCSPWLTIQPPQRVSTILRRGTHVQCIYTSLTPRSAFTLQTLQRRITNSNISYRASSECTQDGTHLIQQGDTTSCWPNRSTPSLRDQLTDVPQPHLNEEEWLSSARIICTITNHVNREVGGFNCFKYHHHLLSSWWWRQNVWKCINSQSRHSHSRRSTSQDSAQNHRSTVNPPIEDAERQSITNHLHSSIDNYPISASFVTVSVGCRIRVANHSSPHLLLNQSDFPTSVDLREIFETTRTGNLIVQRSSLLFTSRAEKDVSLAISILFATCDTQSSPGYAVVTSTAHCLTAHLYVKDRGFNFACNSHSLRRFQRGSPRAQWLTDHRSSSLRVFILFDIIFRTLILTGRVIIK